ncbi:DNA double-strand break repair ATPase Rad50 [Picrophilus oshimae]|uniref:DNA double-strand break repair Rad50 ATPase n=1 Tax=Picrophilus torridus (strain ATCC 700027 / DSM 9790 / JCM 10055 / NBRC 100828 / KAW 2/3) TaxID=1122961 RepID=A0A8G2FY19_PICTO|nr:DNA double-strand break repair ATPase Rad50 [Picrophilus oshimae]SMD31584.1 exonuclease SbcC [Picrophilus oshimae DSM 9789]
MIIKSLKLKNFVSYDDAEIEFTPGITIITGKNGAGKTSIVDAIKFALFTETRNSEKIEEMVKKGKNNLSVMLEFYIGNDVYQVFRSYKFGKGSRRESYIKKNNEIIAEGFDQTTKAIENILGISKDVFKNSIFVGQGEMDSLISGTPKQRKEIFSEILEINSLSRNADKLKDVLKMLRPEISNINDVEEKLKSSNLELENIKKSLADDEKSHSITLKEIERLSIVYQNAMDDYNNAKSAMNELSSLEDMKNRLNSDIKTAESDLSMELEKNNYYKELEERHMKIINDPVYKNRNYINDYFKYINDIENKKQILSNIDAEINKYHAIIKKLSVLEKDYNDYIKKKSEYDDLNNQILELEGYHMDYNGYLKSYESLNMKIREYSINIDPDAIKKELNEINVKLQDYSSKVSSLNQRKRSLIENLDELSRNMEILNGQSVCPVCGTTLGEDKINHIINDYNNKKSGIESKIREIEIDVKDINNKIVDLKKRKEYLESEEINKSINEYNKIESARHDLEDIKIKINELKDKEDKYNEIKNRIKSLKESIEILDSRRTSYLNLLSQRDLIDIDTNQSRSNEIKSQINDLESGLQEIIKIIGFEPDRSCIDKIREMENEANNYNNKYNEIQENKILIEKLRGKIDNYKKQIAEIDSRIPDLKTITSRINDIEDNYNKSRKALDDAKANRARLEATIEINRTRINELSDRINEINETLESMKKIKAAIGFLDELRNALDVSGIQSMIRKEASQAMTSLVRKYLFEFNFDFDDIDIDEDFNIKVSQRSMVQDIDSLSGGEKTALSLALRLAVAEYALNNKSFIIMDEPTNYLDEDRRTNLKDIIQYSLRQSGDIDQLIMITHHSDMSSVADVSYEIDKSSGSSKIIPL